LKYTDTFSPVVKPTTIHVFLTKALSSQWPIHQIDINNAFLCGDLDETVYMQQPPGFVSKDSTLVCKQTKAIYGLKQAPHSWFHKLSQTLPSFGFTLAKSDPSLFTMFSNSFTMFILIYVDDIIITRSSSHAIASLVKNFTSTLCLERLGFLTLFPWH